MRCKTHSSDPGAGVCACCLRERLSALGVSSVEDNGATPSPTIWKKSVSSSSPPALYCPWPPSSRTPNPSNISSKRGKQIPKKGEINDFVLKPSVRPLSLILHRRMKNKKKPANISPAKDQIRLRSTEPHDPPANRRGLSPASDDESEEDGRQIYTCSPSRIKVVATPPPGTQTQQGPRSASSFTGCLNPLVRPSRGNHQSHSPAPTVLSGQSRGEYLRRYGRGGAAVAKISSGLVPNRSRKLVDLGKVW